MKLKFFWLWIMLWFLLLFFLIYVVVKFCDFSYFIWFFIIDKSGEMIIIKGFEGKLWFIDFRYLYKGGKIWNVKFFLNFVGNWVKIFFLWIIFFIINFCFVFKFFILGNDDRFLFKVLGRLFLKLGLVDIL